jgi:cytochrome c oxidase subunit 2
MNLDRRSANRARQLTVLASLTLLLLLVGCQGPFPQTTFSATTEFGADLSGLFWLIFWWAVVVFVVVEVGVIYVLIRFRARPGQEDPAPVHGHTALEIAWTLAPAMIIVFIAVPTIQVIWKDAGADTTNALQVEAIGHQWWWEFRYPEYGIVTANDLYLPQGRPVEVQLTSADVIHSFWLPRLAGKRDMILGRTSRLVFTPDSTGEFWGQCAEYCGTSHANMRFRAFVQSPADFDAWVTNQTSPPAPEASLSAAEAQGLAAYRTRGCVACHAIDGISAGVLGPDLNHFGNRSTVAGGILDNTAENLADWLRDPPGVKPGSLMPNFQLSEDDITALVTYLQSLR